MSDLAALVVIVLAVTVGSGVVTFLDSRVRFKEFGRLEAITGAVLIFGGVFLSISLIPLGYWAFLPIGIVIMLCLSHLTYVAFFRPDSW